VTVEFLGPIAVAVIASRSAQHLLAATLATCGIALLSEGLGGANAAGLAFALGAGTAWAVYILAARRVAAVWPGTSGLTPSVAIAALVVAPFALVQGGSGFADPKALACCAGVGLLGSALPYALDQMSLRRVSARAFSVLLSLHPAIGAVLGFAILGQRIGVQTGIAIGLVVVASAIASRADPPSAEPLPEPA
jgi:inner membrane transporter RhtA